MPTRRFAAIALTALLTAAPALSNVLAGDIQKLTLDEMPLVEVASLPGVSSGFVIGEFAAERLYTAYAKMAQGSTFPPHAHPDTRVTVVVSGTMYLGEGTTFDDSALVAYPEGTAAITPPGTFHYMAAPDGDFTVLEIGSGPSGTQFPNGN